MWDQIPLSWRDYLKFLLEGETVLFAIYPIVAVLRTNSLDGVYIFPLLFVISLLIMRVVEKSMFEVARRLIRGEVLQKIETKGNGAKFQEGERRMDGRNVRKVAVVLGIVLLFAVVFMFLGMFIDIQIILRYDYTPIPFTFAFLVGGALVGLLFGLRTVRHR